MNFGFNLLPLLQLKHLVRPRNPPDQKSTSLPQRPRAHLSYIDSLPRDIQFELLSQLSISELHAFCSTNKHLQSLCQNDRLWEQKVKKDFPHRPAKGTETWHQNYITAYQSQRLKRIIDQYGHNDKQNSEIYLYYNLKLLLNSLPTSEPLQTFATLLKRTTDSSHPLYEMKINLSLTKFYMNADDLPIFNFIVNTPIPGLHYLYINVSDHLRNKELLNKKINNYDISLMDIYLALTQINPIFFSGNFSHSVDLGQNVFSVRYT